MHKAGGVFQRIDQQVIEEELAFRADIDDGGRRSTSSSFIRSILVYRAW